MELPCEFPFSITYTNSVTETACVTVYDKKGNIVLQLDDENGMKVGISTHLPNDFISAYHQIKACLKAFELAMLLSLPKIEALKKREWSTQFNTQIQEDAKSDK